MSKYFGVVSLSVYLSCCTFTFSSLSPVTHPYSIANIFHWFCATLADTQVFFHSFINGKKFLNLFLLSLVLFVSLLSFEIRSISCRTCVGICPDHMLTNTCKWNYFSTWCACLQCNVISSFLNILIGLMSQSPLVFHIRRFDCGKYCFSCVFYCLFCCFYNIFVL